MQKISLARNRKSESGQTIAIVALSLVSLFAMAAIAIDVASLYSARAEAQKAADAAALAAAKAFVDSGYTANTGAKTLAENMATAYAQAIASQNNVAGSPPSLLPPTFDDTTYPGNPQVTVQVQQTNLPIFFAKIWGVSLLKVSATASAEAYNPSNSQSTASTGNQFIASAPGCVKPLAVPNADNATGGSPYIDRTTGVVQGTPIGEAFNVTSFCQPKAGGPACPDPPTTPATLIMGKYVPIVPDTLPPTTTYSCPSCALATQPIRQSLECCNTTVYQCGLGNTSAEATITYTGYSRFTTSFTLRCATQPFGLPDVLDRTSIPNYPNTPIQITAGSGPSAGQSVNTSGSIMTFPIWDNTGNVKNGKIHIIGFVQAFVDSPTFSSSGNLTGTVLNVVGCGNNPSGTQVSGGGTSPIPVRLIHQ